MFPCFWFHKHPRLSSTCPWKCCLPFPTPARSCWTHTKGCSYNKPTAYCSIAHILISAIKGNYILPQYPTVGIPSKWLLMLGDVVKWAEFIFVPAKWPRTQTPCYVFICKIKYSHDMWCKILTLTLWSWSTFQQADEDVQGLEEDISVDRISLFRLINRKSLDNFQSTSNSFPSQHLNTGLNQIQAFNDVKLCYQTLELGSLWVAVCFPEPERDCST